MNYFIVLNNELIIKSYTSTSNHDDTEISKTEYKKIKWEDGKIYKYIGKKVKVEDDPEYNNRRLEQYKARKFNEINTLVLNKIIESDTEYKNKQKLIEKAKTIEELDERYDMSNAAEVVSKVIEDPRAYTLIEYILMGIFGVLSSCAGLGSYLVVKVINNDKEFSKNYTKLVYVIEKIKDDQSITDDKLKILESILEAVKNTQEELLPLVRDHHNKMAVKARGEIKLKYGSSWDKGYVYIKDLIKENHEKYYKNEDDYYNFILDKGIQYLVEIVEGIQKEVNPMGIKMTRQVSNSVFSEFLEDIKRFVYEISESKKLKTDWSLDLKKIFTTYKMAWDTNFDIFYGQTTV